MSDFTIHGDIKELERFAHGISLVPRGIPTAMSRALNKTITGARTDAVTLIRHDFNIKAGEVRKELIVERATTAKLQAALRGTGSPGIPLFKFGAMPRRAPSTKRLKGGGYSPKGGISATVRRGQRRQIKNAFTAKMSSGHVGIFQLTEGRMRKRNRQAIKELFGPSPIKLLAGDRYDERMEDLIQVRLDKNMKHEAEHVLRQFGVIR